MKKGLEREMAELYAKGQVSLREGAEVLALPVREYMEFMWQLGVPGNISTAQALEGWDAVEKLSS